MPFVGVLHARFLGQADYCHVQHLVSFVCLTGCFVLKVVGALVGAGCKVLVWRSSDADLAV